MNLKDLQTEWKRRHLNPKIAKGAIGLTLLGSLAVGSVSYYHSNKAMAEAASISEEAQSQMDVYNKSVQNYESQIARLTEANSRLLEENASLKGEMEELRREVKRGHSIEGGFEVEVTAYTLSPEDCGKGAGHPGYGLTANGTNLAGQSLWSARAIAVDPSVIPLGSQVQISFMDDSMKKYDGVYTACDTGGAIRGNIIDLFAGEGADDLANHIGRRRAIVKVLA